MVDVPRNRQPDDSHLVRRLSSAESDARAAARELESVPVAGDRDRDLRELLKNARDGQAVSSLRESDSGPGPAREAVTLVDLRNRRSGAADASLQADSPPRNWADGAVAKSTAEFCDWAAQELVVIAAHAVVPGLGHAVKVAFEVVNLVDSLRALTSDRPVLVVPLARIAPGLDIAMSAQLGDFTQRRSSGISGFVAPDVPSLTGGWCLEMPEEAKQPQGSSGPSANQEPDSDAARAVGAVETVSRMVDIGSGDAVPPVSIFAVELDFGGLRLEGGPKAQARWLSALAIGCAERIRAQGLSSEIELLIFAERRGRRGMWIWLVPSSAGVTDALPADGEVVGRILAAADRYSRHYDEVLWQVGDRIRRQGDAGKLELAALICWKRCGRGRWVSALMEMPDDSVRELTRAALAAGIDDQQRLDVLAPLPGFGSKAAIATTLLACWCPEEFGVLDRRALAGLARIGRPILRGPGETLRYLDRLRQLRDLARASRPAVTARHIDQGLWLIGGE